jgi:tRNA pseudouridine65 synthase
VGGHPARLEAPRWLHLDEHLGVLAKPSGLAVHRGASADAEVLTDWLRRELGPGAAPVHRLDRGTSGVVVVARSPEAARALGAQLEARTVHKRYLALVRGALAGEHRVDHPLPPHEGATERVPAITVLRGLATCTLDDSPLRERRYTWLEALPETGRFHQVRRHAKHLGHPVIGDANYGRSEHNRLLAERVGLRRLALHAASIEIVHPATDAPLRIDAPLPDDLAGPLTRLGLAL